jgi:non-specific serine/threonine protein kinase/serine/threonine-protein kinase
MTPERWQRVKALFAAAVEREAGERARFLAGAASDDPTLADEVLRLVALDERVGDYLSAPAAAPPSLPAPVVELEPASLVDRRVGPYRLVGEIGHGGMGAVYVGVRDDDQYHKRVAIKVARGGMSSELLVQRFKAERQILADLEHPNIARFIDGGASEEGWPYFSMEYVEGQPIDRYCERRGLSTRERVELFLTVCSAVHYAHQRLVVHRDLKPSNILVTGAGDPKLLDFGIAKLLAGDATQTAHTAAPMMTPDYASPEQVRGAAITTGSDVYSLGLILYELLARTRAYQIESHSPEEIVRTVCHLEPPKPSAVVERSLARLLRGDLDAVVMKALRKESSQRYASVQELAEDLRRHLAGTPVTARRGTALYRAGKFVRRNKAGLTAAALVVISLVGGIVATARQARISEVNRARAERRFDDVRRIANSFLFEFHDAVEKLPGATPLRELVVKRATEYLASLSTDEHADVALKRELAVSFQRLGDIQGGGAEGNLGDVKGALRSYQQALALRLALAGRPDADPLDIVGLAELESHLGSFWVKGGELARAEEILGSAAHRLETLSSMAEDVRDRLAAVHHRLGYTQARRGDERGALTSLRASLAYGDAFLADHPGDSRVRGSVALARTAFAERLWRAGDLQGAAEQARGARAVQEELLATDPQNARLRRNLCETLGSEGVYLESVGHRREAIDVLARGLALAESELQADPENRWYKVGVGMLGRALGNALVGNGEASAGLEHLRRATERAEQAVADDPGNAFALNQLALNHEAVGRVLLETGADDEARSQGCRGLERAVGIWRDLEKAGRLFAENDLERRRGEAAWAGCPR